MTTPSESLRSSPSPLSSSLSCSSACSSSSSIPNTVPTTGTVPTPNGSSSQSDLLFSPSFSSAVELSIGTTQFAPDPRIHTILVTGGLGFIASWLVRHLVFQYPSYRVVCLDNRSYCSSLSNIKACFKQSNFVFMEADITDAKRLHEIIDLFDVDTIIHMAAESHVGNSFDNALKFTLTNVIGTQNLLEAAKLSNLMNEDIEDGDSSETFPSPPKTPFRKGKRPIYRFVHMSTDEVYGETALSSPSFASADVTETAMLAPTNPYSASKASGDMFVHAYRKSYNLPIVSARFNNVYGPMQFPEKIIPKFIRQLEKNRRCTLHGSGENLRRYLYVSDAVNALDVILHKGKIGSIYNVGADTELSNLQVAKKLIQNFSRANRLNDMGPDDMSETLENVPKISQNSKGYLVENQAALSDISSKELDSELFNKYIKFTKDRPFNDSRYAIDSTQMHKLGWQPLVDFDSGLEMTINWYNEHSDEWWQNQ